LNKENQKPKIKNQKQILKNAKTYKPKSIFTYLFLIFGF